MRTFDLGQAADFLKINYSTASRMASTGMLPGAKIGSSWVFLEQELAEWLREQTIRQQRERLALANAEAQLEEVNNKPTTKNVRHRQPVPLPELPSKIRGSKISISS